MGCAKNQIRFRPGALEQLCLCRMCACLLMGACFEVLQACVARIFMLIEYEQDLNTGLLRQSLERELRKLLDALEEENRKVNDGTMHVPPHLVTLKLGNRQKVMLPNRASFGPMTMAKIVAKAGLFKGEDAQDAGTRVDEDDFYLMKLQHDKVSWKWFACGPKGCSQANTSTRRARDWILLLLVYCCQIMLKCQTMEIFSLLVHHQFECWDRHPVPVPYNHKLNKIYFTSLCPRVSFLFGWAWCIPCYHNTSKFGCTCPHMYIHLRCTTLYRLCGT